jgi:sugar phosphate isomerase/epimerase
VQPRVGIGSYAYRYAIGFRGFNPGKPMSIADFLETAAHGGWEGVQLCENLGYADLSDADLAVAAAQARRLQLFVEIGLNGLTDRKLGRHLDVAEMFGSDLIRVVVGETGVEESLRILRSALPRVRSQRTRLGLENHFDLTMDQLVGIVRQLGDEQVGIIFDTTNGLGFLEKPEEDMVKAQPYLVSMHIKDYTIRKVEAGYFVTGAVLGKGTLDVPAVLRCAAGAPNLGSIILEMTVKRDETAPVDAVIHREQAAVLESRDYLVQELSKVSSFRCNP